MKPGIFLYNHPFTDLFKKTWKKWWQIIKCGISILSCCTQP